MPVRSEPLHYSMPFVDGSILSAIVVRRVDSDETTGGAIDPLAQLDKKKKYDDHSNRP